MAAFVIEVTRLIPPAQQRDLSLYSPVHQSDDGHADRKHEQQMPTLGNGRSIRECIPDSLGHGGALC